jgi:DNA uptake protein ComE-like DNA-binding protein
MYSRSVRFIWLLTLLISLASGAAWPTPQNQDSNPSSARTKRSKKDKGTAETSDQNTAGKASKVDLNTATKEELDALPGIGASYAQKIIEARPYKSKSDLVRKGVLPSSAYDKIKDQVTARQTGKSTSSEETPKGAAATPAKPSPAQPETKPSQPKRAQNSESVTPTTAQTPPEKGMVWVNLSSGVYHREGDRWYGKTKNGKFMSESDAEKAGYRASKSGGKKESQKEQ